MVPSQLPALTYSIRLYFDIAFLLVYVCVYICAKIINSNSVERDIVFMSQMGPLETGGPLLDLTYRAPGLGPINVCRADLGQVGTWA